MVFSNFALKHFLVTFDAIFDFPGKAGSSISDLIRKVKIVTEGLGGLLKLIPVLKFAKNNSVYHYFRSSRIVQIQNGRQKSYKEQSDDKFNIRFVSMGHQLIRIMSIKLKY